ncbi:MAG: Hsp20 family protein, partial [Succinivibrio sp.]|nr:Hsp20 family protein [Succinivibrio sp.]
KAERKQEKEEKNEQGYLVRERSYGSYSRAFRFEDADPSKINASLNDGVLNIDVMKAVKPETKTSIAIN